MPPTEPDEALAAEAHELYGLALEDFTAARNARAKAVQAAGDRDLAAAIRALAKPSVAAGLANQLVRADPDALEPLLELGVELREATAALDGARMRTLSREQGKVVTALVRRAGQLSTSGRVSPGVAQELDETFRAAVADADAADLLMGACLSTALQYNGFGLVAPGGLALVPTPRVRARAGTTSPAVASATSGGSARERAAEAKRSGQDELRAQRLAAAEQEVDEARVVADAATAQQEQAAEGVQDAERAATQARHRLEEVREEIERAKFALSRAEGVLRQAKQAQDQVDRRGRAAQRGLEDALAKRDKLSR